MKQNNRYQHLTILMLLLCSMAMATVTIDNMSVNLLFTDTIPLDTIPSDTIPSDTIPSDTIPSDTIPADTVKYPPEQYLSGTLPVMYITTEDNLPIVSKTEYLNATWYLDAMGIEGIEDIGNVDEQYALEIKGRGNSSWVRPKKPYRLKLKDKVPLLGMPANKHFVLIAEWPDGVGRLDWEMAFFVSRLVGLPWTCEHHPIELVLNGEYQGLYFLTEKIRVDKERVNITEQKDEETDPEKITGGWLCEIDNYASSTDPQIVIRDRTTLKYIITTVHTPEVLSNEQKKYITNFIKATDQAIYSKDKTSTEWERYIDIDRLARYYMACEIIYQVEGFSGSCYWSKDRGDDTKICFGPMWDFDTSNIGWPIQKFFYEQQEGDHIVGRNHWIMELAKYPRFQQRVRELWQAYCDSAVSLIEPHAMEWLERVTPAHYKDVERWYKDLHHYANLEKRSALYLTNFWNRHAWLTEQWSKPVPVIGDANGDSIVNRADVNTLCRHLLCQPVDTLAWATANTYDDDTLDICDHVGVLRLIYRQEHPDAQLRYHQVLPVGKNDKAIYNKLNLNVPEPGNAIHMVSTDEQQVELQFDGPTAFTAFEFDITSPSVAVTNVVLHDSLTRHHLESAQLNDSVTRVIVYSDSLASITGGDSTARITLTLRYLAESESLDHNTGVIKLSNIHVSEDDMTPHYLADSEFPVNWWREPLLGDVNIDGQVDVEDLNTLLNIMVKRQSKAQFPYSDLNHSGLVDVEDANIVINVMVNKERFTDYEANGVKFRMIRVEGDTFMMGATTEQMSSAQDNELPAHEVTLSNYHIGETEVTQSLWQAVMGYNPSHFTGDPQRPVDSVSWDECQEFISRLNTLTGKSFRLPTEAEWEFAARGGSGSKGYKYSGGNTANNVAWRSANADSTTHAVAQKAANELGLYDMSGNVYEWCQDWYGPYTSEAQLSPMGPAEGTTRVCRGGAWTSSAANCRVSRRIYKKPTLKDNRFGLRLVM